MYQPQELAKSSFSLRNETIAVLSSIEREIVRFDERIKHSLAASPVRATMVRADALGSLGMDNKYPDIYTIMRIEAAGHLLDVSEDTDDAINDLLAGESHPTMDSSLLAYRTMQATRWICDTKSTAKIIEPYDMLTLYARSRKGPNYKKHLCSFREHVVTERDTEKYHSVYEPPRPADLGPLLEDFCTFLNQDTLSPISQASIMQFQFEALKAFDDNLDRIERLLMHYVFRRRHFLENTILPINLFSANFEDRFYNLLKPNYENAVKNRESVELYVEDLTLHAAHEANDLLNFALTLHKTVLSLVNAWKKRLGRLQKGSTIELLLYELTGTPVMTIAQGSELVGRSFSATSDAFARLEQKGIVRAGNSIRRNTTFEAPDAMLLHDLMYKKQARTYSDFVEVKGEAYPVKVDSSFQEMKN